MVVMITPSGKGFFLIPWRGHTLIGTTDKEYVGNPDEFRVTKAAILELLETVNGTLGDNARVEYGDVLRAYGGLRPLVEDQTKEVYESSRKYEIYDNARDGFPGLITVEGGKYTTSRGLAQNVMKTVARKLNKDLGQCLTAKQHLAGCEIQDIGQFINELKTENEDFDEKTVECLARFYGRECRGVIELARQDRALSESLNDDGEIPAQAVYAIRNEMALTLKDILFRRTGIGALGYPGDDKIARIADLAANELDWDDERKDREISDAKELFKLPD
jgi:glycerol-3-phosphate dehydrogenase